MQLVIGDLHKVYLLLSYFIISTSVSLSLITFHSVVGAKLRPEEEKVILDPLEELGNLD